MPADCAIKKASLAATNRGPLATITASESQAGCLARSVIKRASGKSGSRGPLLRWKSKKTKDICLLTWTPSSLLTTRGVQSCRARPGDGPGAHPANRK
jgi:hypothetical protein